MRMRVQELKNANASISRLPSGSGDGYGYGGGIILNIGDRSFVIGESEGSYELAEAIAERWNAGRIIAKRPVGASDDCGTVVSY